VNARCRPVTGDHLEACFQDFLYISSRGKNRNKWSQVVTGHGPAGRGGPRACDHAESPFIPPSRMGSSRNAAGHRINSPMHHTRGQQVTRASGVRYHYGSTPE